MLLVVLIKKCVYIKVEKFFKKNNLFIGKSGNYTPDSYLHYVALGLNKIGKEKSALAKKDEIFFPYYVAFTRDKIKELASEIIKKVEKLEK